MTGSSAVRRPSLQGANKFLFKNFFKANNLSLRKCPCITKTFTYSVSILTWSWGIGHVHPYPGWHHIPADSVWLTPRSPAPRDERKAAAIERLRSDEDSVQPPMVSVLGVARSHSQAWHPPPYLLRLLGLSENQRAISDLMDRLGIYVKTCRRYKIMSG